MALPTTLTLLAEAETSGNFMESLGIDVRLLIFQIIAFLILLWALSKFVFPVFFRIIDQRQAAIDESNKAAVEASKRADESKKEIEKLLKQARTEATDIVATAKDEAVSIAARAEEKSKLQAERIVADARASIDKDVIEARKALHNETIDLIAAATEKVTSRTVDVSSDRNLITKSLEEVK